MCRIRVLRDDAFGSLLAWILIDVETKNDCTMLAEQRRYTKYKKNAWGGWSNNRAINRKKPALT